MTAARMITATTMPNTDVTYDAFPRSRAVLVACGSPSDSLRRANTTQCSQSKHNTLVVHLQQQVALLLQIGREMLCVHHS